MVRNMHTYLQVSTLLTDPECSDLIFLDRQMKSVTNLTEKYVEKNGEVYAIPKINMLCNLCCLKTRLRLLCNKYQQHSSLNLVSQQLKLCNILIFGMAYFDGFGALQGCQSRE